MTTEKLKEAAANHINLIKNHGYKGFIAIYEGPQLMAMNTGALVLVQERDMPRIQDVGIESVNYYKNHSTMEFPHSEEKIQENIKKKGFKGIITFCTTVGVPNKFLKKIDL